MESVDECTTASTRIANRCNQNTPMDFFAGTGPCCEWTGIDWHALFRWLVFHPEEAKKCDPRGYYLLHKVVAADYPPAPLCVVGLVFDAYPDAIKHRTFIGSTVLEVATCNRRIGRDVFKFLLASYPEAAAITCELGFVPLHYVEDDWKARALIEAFPRGLGIQDKLFGCTPLMCATKDLFTPPDVVQTLINEGWKHQIGGPDGGGGVFAEDMYGLAPLSWIAGCMEVVLEVDRSISEVSKDSRPGSVMICDAERTNMWQKLKVIAQAAYSAKAKSKSPTPEPLLCCLIGAGYGSPIFISHVLATNPAEVKLRDSRGRTPLHVAASVAGIDASIFDMLLSSKHGKATAGMADENGRLPLHLAAESGLCLLGGVQSIVKADGRALGTMDSLTGAYPFMLAAIGEDSCINVVYSLLREVPDKLKHHVCATSCRKRKRHEQ